VGLSGLARPPHVVGRAAPIVAAARTICWSGACANPDLARLAHRRHRAAWSACCARGDRRAVHFHSHVVPEDAAGDDNVANARTIPGLHDAVLVGVARREQGCCWLPQSEEAQQPRRRARRARENGVRQPGAGAQMLLEALLARAAPRQRTAPARTVMSHRPDLAAAIRAGKADCGVAPRAAAIAAGLDFVPLVWENFDLLMRQRSYFRPSCRPDRLSGRRALRQRATNSAVTTRPAARSASPPDRIGQVDADRELIAKPRPGEPSSRPSNRADAPIVMGGQL